jgi:hypothetical protein
MPLPPLLFALLLGTRLIGFTYGNMDRDVRELDIRYLDGKAIAGLAQAAGIYQFGYDEPNDLNGCFLLLDESEGRPSARQFDVPQPEHFGGGDAREAYDQVLWQATKSVTYDAAKAVVKLKLAKPCGPFGRTEVGLALEARFADIAAKNPQDGDDVRPRRALVVDAGSGDRFFLPRARRLRDAQLTASSSLREGNVEHRPELAVDGDDRTAWAEGKPGPRRQVRGYVHQRGVLQVANDRLGLGSDFGTIPPSGWW